MATNQPLTLRIGSSFGPVVVPILTDTGAVQPLAGWSAFAEVRTQPESAVLLDLAPVIAADDALGHVTLPAITPAATALLDPVLASWDLILQDPDGNRTEPVMEGTFTITRSITPPSS